MKILATSDWHGDAFTGGYDRFDDVRGAVAQSMVTADVEDVDLYLFCGDLADPGPRAHRCTELLVDTAVTLKQQGVDFLAITGNHDVVEDGTGSHTLCALKPLALVNDYPDHNIIGGVNFLSLPFTARSHAYDPVKTIEHWATYVGKKTPAPTVIVGHLNLEGISPGSETTSMPRGRDVYWPMDAIREHFPKALCIGGHYHEQQVYDGVHIVGSLQRLTFAEEENEPAFMMFEV